MVPQRMGKANEFSRALTASDSGYGDDTVEKASSASLHPLARKGYEIGPASKLQIGDVFEFLWADCPEFEWEWKCLGYTRFIVLRHSDSFPHYCACVPISVGGKRDFAKPGIDTLQQGYVYASGEKDRDRDGAGAESQSSHQQQKNLPPLPYSSVGISLRSSRHRVKDDSRANYADIVEVDHEAQVMVVGDVARYFDRVRKNVNKAFMRQILREALSPYCQRKKSESAAAGVRGWGNSAVALARAPDEDPERAEHAGPSEAGGSGGGEKQQQLLLPEEDEEEVVMAAAAAATQDPIGTPLEKDMEDFLSDTTREEDDWDGGGLQSPAAAAAAAAATTAASYSGRPSDERRAMRAVSRGQTPRDGLATARPGRDSKTGRGQASLRGLRQGVPGGDDHDDTLSLRSLAMVGRSDSFASRRSRK